MPTLKQTLSLAAMLLGLPFVAAPLAHADPTATARQAIQAAFNRENTGFAHKDAKAVLADVTPDYVDIESANQSFNLEQSRATLGDLFAKAKSLSAHTTITSITSRDGGMEVTAHDRSVAMLPDPHTSQIIRYVADSTSRSFWVKQGSSWRKKRVRALSSSQTANGKPVPSQ